MVLLNIAFISIFLINFIGYKKYNYLRLNVSSVKKSDYFKSIIFSVHALYSTTHPEFASYLYLVAPISLVFLNPIGFIMMEVRKFEDVSISSSKIISFKDSDNSNKQL